jgi:hypothetical protein
MCPLECIWIDGMVHLWLRPPFWQTMAVLETSCCSNRISTYQKIRGATHFTACGIGCTEARRHHCQNRYEAVAHQDPLWHCAPLYLTSRFIAKFGLFGFLRVTRITEYSVIWVTRITKFGNSDEFGWVQMIQIWRALKPNLASGV